MTTTTTKTTTTADRLRAGQRYAWVVFALTVGLMLSDFMTRSVMNAVLRDVQGTWGLSDTQLGLLVSVVPLVVGIGAWPIALLADRIGYVRSIAVMGAVWCIATVLCGLSQTHTQLLLARAAVGLGEAGYGAVGAALLASLFPAARMSSVLGAFQSAAVFGTALGVVVGGVLGARYGWQAAFIWVGAASLLLVILYPVFVREPPRISTAGRAQFMRPNEVLRSLFSKRSARYTFLASGLQAVILGVVAGWLPTFLAREYGFPVDAAGTRAGLVILVLGVGMIAGGALADRAARRSGHPPLRLAGAYTLGSFVLLAAAFAAPAGPAQGVLLLSGALLAGAHTGIVAAAILDATDRRLRATAIATMSLFNNVLGLAGGPYLIGVLSDATSLKFTMTIVPVFGLGAALFFELAARQRAHERKASLPVTSFGAHPGA